MSEEPDGAAPVDDLSDPQNVDRKARQSRRRHAQLAGVVALLMSTREGRAWMFELLGFCHVFATSFVQGDPYGSHFKMGEHNVGLRLIAECTRSSPENFVKMLREGNRGDV